MADRVDARVQGVQPADLEPMRDPSSAKSETQQLTPPDNAILPLGNRSDLGVRSTSLLWGTHEVPKGRLVLESPLGVFVPVAAFAEVAD